MTTFPSHWTAQREGLGLPPSLGVGPLIAPSRTSTQPGTPFEDPSRWHEPRGSRHAGRTTRAGIAFATALCLVIGTGIAGAAVGDFASRQTGDWNVVATWCKFLTGTATFVNGNTAVTGVGTLFTTQLVAGDVLMLQGSTGTILGTVSSITDATHLTLTSGANGAGSGAYGKEATPTSADGAITILTGHTVTVTANVTVDQVTVNAGGQVTVNNGITWTVANGTGTDVTINGTLNVNGTLNTQATTTMSVGSGGNLNINNGATATGTSISTISVTGNLTLNGNATYTISRGNGGDVITVNSGGVVTVNDTAQIIIGSVATAAMTVASGGQVIVGPSAVIKGTSSAIGTFTLSSGASLSIGSTAGIVLASSGASGNIQTSVRTFNTGANYTYNGTAAQATGDGLPATVNNLTINNASGVNISANDVIVSGTLALTNGEFCICGYGLTLNGAIATTAGTLRGGGFTAITFGGSGASTSLPAVANGISTLTVNRANGISLGGSNTVVTLTLTSGALSIGANTLTISGAISTSSGSLTGGATSNITFSGSGASTTLPAVANGLNDLTINRATGISLGADATVGGTLTLTSGALSIGANTLTINGAISTSSGSLTGGATSNITFGGSGASTTLPAVTNGLNNLTLNRANGISLGADSTIAGTLTLTSGALSIGANTLTINGAISTSSGSLTGGASSNITFGGSGASTALPAVTSGLNNLTINRANGISLGGDVTVGGTLTLTSGALSIGANTLTINGAISATSGSLTGGSSSNISIGGSGASTTLPAVTLNNLTMNRPNGITLGGNVTVGGTLTLSSGNITASSFPLALGTSAAISQTSGYVIGYLRKDFSGAVSFVFTVGTANGYSPVDVNGSATGAQGLTVSATQSCHPSMYDCTHALQRYWTLTPTADFGLTLDLTFHYLAGDVQGTESAYYIVKYSGGWSFPDLQSVDPGTHTGTVSGVTSFSDWTLAEGSAPTAVKLISLSATEQGGKVLVSWRTGFEVDNLGFHVYREQGGERVRVTPSLVAGSALFAGVGTALTAGRSYAWWDPAPVAGASYWLEEWDLSGEKRWHGPVVVEPGPVGADAQGVGGASGSSVKATSAVVPARLLATLGAAPAPAHTVRRKLRRGVESGEDRLAVQWGLAAGAAVKILVSGEGWYRVSQEELVMAGLDPGVDASRLQLFTDGQQVPILVDAREQGRFSPGDRIEFYGLGLDTPASGVRVYWLVVGADAGERIQEEDGVGSWPSGPPSFPSEVERADRTLYVPAVLNGEASNFFGAVVTTTPVSEVVQVRHLDRSGAGALAVRLQGGTAGPHQVGVELNGNRVGTLTWTGMTTGELAIPLGPGMAFEGDNVVTLTAEGGDGDVSLVDVVRLRYAHKWEADGEALACTLDGFQKVTITSFVSEKVRVFDITDAMRPQQVVGEVSGSGGEYAVQFGVPEAGERTVLAVGTGAVLHPVGVLANRPAAWHSASPGADLVIIAHRSLLASVEPLRALREGQGVKVAVVDVEDVYDEFSYGEKDPQAIRDFMGWARRSWARAPRFLLLVGGASYDPRGYLGLAGADLVPTKLVDTKYMETASDDWFVDFDGDGIGDIPVGRLPVGRVDRATAVVAKIVAYERSAPGSTALLVADADDSENDFEGMSERVKTALPASVAPTSVYRGQLGDAAAASELASQLASGQSLVHYAGHGTVDAWHGGLLTAAQVAALHNEQLPFVVTMTCLNGFFQDPSQQSLAQAWLEARGGAVAVWASSALTESAAQAPLDEALVRLLFPAQGPQPTLGEATRAAKASSSNPDVRTTWILFGDPSARLK